MEKRYSVNRYYSQRSNRNSHGDSVGNSLYRQDGSLSPLRSPLQKKDCNNHSNRISTETKEKKEDDRKKSSSVCLVVNENTPDTVTSPCAKLDWADLCEEVEKQQERARNDLSHYQERIRRRKESESSSGSGDRCSSTSAEYEIETDENVLMRRQKQIDYGKCTGAYNIYANAISKSARIRGQHPYTPNKFNKYSRRGFDNLIKIWKLQVHRSSETLATPSSEGTRSDTGVTPSIANDCENTKPSRKQLNFASMYKDDTMKY